MLQLWALSKEEVDQEVGIPTSLGHLPRQGNLPKDGGLRSPLHEEGIQQAASVPMELSYGPSLREYSNVVDRQSHILRVPHVPYGDVGTDGGVSPLWCVFRQALEQKVEIFI